MIFSCFINFTDYLRDYIINEYQRQAGRISAPEFFRVLCWVTAFGELFFPEPFFCARFPVKTYFKMQKIWRAYRYGRCHRSCLPFPVG